MKGLLGDPMPLLPVMPPVEAEAYYAPLQVQREDLEAQETQLQQLQQSPQTQTSPLAGRISRMLQRPATNLLKQVPHDLAHQGSAPLRLSPGVLETCQAVFAAYDAHQPGIMTRVTAESTPALIQALSHYFEPVQQQDQAPPPPQPPPITQEQQQQGMPAAAAATALQPPGTAGRRVRYAASSAAVAPPGAEGSIPPQQQEQQELAAVPPQDTMSHQQQATRTSARRREQLSSRQSVGPGTAGEEEVSLALTKICFSMS